MYIAPETNLELLFIGYYIAAPAHFRLNWAACGPRAKMSLTALI